MSFDNNRKRTPQRLVGDTCRDQKGGLYHPSKKVLMWLQLPLFGQERESNILSVEGGIEGGPEGQRSPLNDEGGT